MEIWRVLLFPQAGPPLGPPACLHPIRVDRVFAFTSKRGGRGGLMPGLRFFLGKGGVGGKEGWDTGMAY